jgi:hypothetical protein
MDLNLTTENIGFPSSTADMAFSGVGAPEISLEFFRFFLTVKRGKNPHLIQVWKVKKVKEAKKQKKVSFADPVATEFKPPKRAQPDDSVFLIKGNYQDTPPPSSDHLFADIFEGESMFLYAPKSYSAIEPGNEQHSGISKYPARVETVKMQQALAATLKLMETTIAATGKELVCLQHTQPTIFSGALGTFPGTEQVDITLNDLAVEQVDNTMNDLAAK